MTPTRRMSVAALLLVLLLATCSNLAAAFLPQSPQPATDWLEAELTLRNFPPNGPSPNLSPAQVATACLRSLQFVDYPSTSSGFERVYPFLTWQCLRAVMCKDVVNGAIFSQYAALSPTLQPLFGATRIDVHEGKATSIAATKNRGAIMSYPVTVYGAEVLAFQHKSGMMRNGVAAGPPKIDIVIRLEQARRPPLANCWLIMDIVNTSYAKGGLGWSRHEGV